MKQEQQQAQRLFFQTDLSKTEIAETLDISRRTLHNWVHDNNWERLKKSATYMPSLLAENCYFIMAKFTEQLLSPERAGQPITTDEVNSLHKLAITIGKLKSRSTLNENMETFANFLDSVNSKSPEMAQIFQPFVDDYLSSNASKNNKTDMPPKFTVAPKPNQAELDAIEAQLDLEDQIAWSQNPAATPKLTQTPNYPPINKPLDTTPKASSLPLSTTQTHYQREAKIDLRKQLRGTATTGPGKSFHKNQLPPQAA